MSWTDNFNNTDKCRVEPEKEEFSVAIHYVMFRHIKLIYPAGFDEISTRKVCFVASTCSTREWRTIVFVEWNTQ